MNLGTALTLVGAAIGDSPTEPEGRLLTLGTYYVHWAVNAIIDEINRRVKGCGFLYTSITIDAEAKSVQDYPMPWDFGIAVSVVSRLQSDNTATPYRMVVADDFFKEEATDSRSLATIHGTPPRLRLSPVPSDPSDVTVAYRRAQRILSKTVDEIILPPEFDESLIAMASAGAAAVWQPGRQPAMTAHAKSVLNRRIAALNAGEPDDADRARLDPAQQYEFTRHQRKGR